MTEKQYNDLAKWQQETFPSGTVLSKLAHLQEEVQELIDEIKGGDYNAALLEFADCQLLLNGAMASSGLTYENTCDIVDQKMEINRKRVWAQPDARGVVNHIKTVKSKADDMDFGDNY